MFFLDSNHQVCVQPNFKHYIFVFFFPIMLHLREDEEEGGGADQQAGGRAHRDEGAGLQRVDAAGGHPVLSARVRVPSLTERETA